MNSKLEILLVEDSVDDAKLVERALRAGGIEFSSRRVETSEEFLRALTEQRPDVILADYNLPHFDGATALKLAKEFLPSAPVIIVTGTMIDEAAVELLRAGAADYLLKDRLSRLAPAVIRALISAAEARTRADAELAMKLSELRYRRLFESALDGILILDRESGRIIDANPFIVDLLEFSRAELIGKSLRELGQVKDGAAATNVFEHLQGQDSIHYENLPLVSKSGKVLEVEFISNAYEVERRRYIQCNIRDVRERQAAQRLLQEQLAELRRFQRVTVDRELRLHELEAEIARIKAGRQ